MIKISSTVSVIKHSTLVSLEDELVSFDGDGKDLLGSGGLHGLNVFVGADHPTSRGLDRVNVSGSVCGLIALDVLAGGAGSVGPVGFEDTVVGLREVEGSGLVTTIASERKLDTIDVLLFREAQEFLSGGSNAVSTFHGTGR